MVVREGGANHTQMYARCACPHCPSRPAKRGGRKMAHDSVVIPIRGNALRNKECRHPRPPEWIPRWSVGGGVAGVRGAGCIRKSSLQSIRRRPSAARSVRSYTPQCVRLMCDNNFRTANDIAARSTGGLRGAQTTDRQTSLGNQVVPGGARFP